MFCISFLQDVGMETMAWLRLGKNHDKSKKTKNKHEVVTGNKLQPPTSQMC